MNTVFEEAHNILDSLKMHFETFFRYLDDIKFPLQQ